MRLRAKSGGRILEVTIERSNGTYSVEIDGKQFDVDSHKLEADFYSILIDGLVTSLNFHRQVMHHPAFVRGDLHTGFVGEHPELLSPGGDPWLSEIAVVAAAVAHFRRAELASQGRAGVGPSAWKWRS